MYIACCTLVHPLQFYDSLTEQLQTLNVTVVDRRFSGTSASGDGSDVLETNDLFVSINSYLEYDWYSKFYLKSLCPFVAAGKGGFCFLLF